MTNTMNWQDYRGKGEGVLVHVDGSKKHALPVREPLQADKELLLEPSYETNTFGFIQCYDARTRQAILKNRRRYVLFGTRYQGSVEEFKGKFFIIGYMRLDQILEVRKRHVHKWMEKNTGLPPECMELEGCYSFRSDEMRFYKIEDCFELPEKLMKEWGYKGKITKQMKLTFTEDKVNVILEHFAAKPPANELYVEAVKDLEAQAMAALEQANAPQEESW
jgi:hypothetical protein